MEDDDKQDVREKCKNRSSSVVSNAEEEEEIQRSRNENEDDTNACRNSTIHRNPRYSGINSKSDSWFIVGGTHQQVKMILPNKNNERLYFSCGDVDVFTKYSKRINLSDEELLKKIKPCQDYENKVKELKRYLIKNLLIADLKINMYIAACNKHCLSPYPAYIIEDSVVGMESLALINDFIPPVGVLQHYLNKTKNFAPNEHVINVLHWLLVTFAEPVLNKSENKTFERILNKVEHLTNLKYPNHVFVLKHKRISEGLWQAEKGNMESKFAFLPINMEHAHSVVHLGMHPQIFTEGIHGVGLYLTTDLKCCLESTQAQWVWGKSMLAIEAQIILEVEFINHPNVITYTEKKALCKDQNSSDTKSETAQFYFLPSHKLVRARFLMLYVKTPSTLKPIPGSKVGETFDLYYKHTFLYLTLTLSALILAKRSRFTAFAKNLLANIAALPLVKHCLSIVH